MNGRHSILFRPDCKRFKVHCVVSTDQNAETSHRHPGMSNLFRSAFEPFSDKVARSGFRGISNRDPCATAGNSGASYGPSRFSLFY